MPKLIGSLGSILKIVASPVSKILHRIPDGKATGTGATVVAAGVAGYVASNAIITDANILAVLDKVAMIVTALGTVVAAWGDGRAKGRTKK